MYAAFYPSVRDSAPSLQGYLKHMPEAIKNLIGGDFTSPAGYLRTETFSTLEPILFLVFAIGSGARAIAGEEEGRTLDLLLSTPIRRDRVLLDKWISMVLATLGLAVIMGITIALVGPVVRPPCRAERSGCRLPDAVPARGGLRNDRAGHRMPHRSEGTRDRHHGRPGHRHLRAQRGRALGLRASSPCDLSRRSAGTWIPIRWSPA